MTRTYSFARRKAWVNSAERVGDRWRAHVALIGIGVFVVAAFALVPGLPVRLLYCGIIAGAVLTMLVISVSGMDDPVMLGSMAEEWTAEAFAKQKWPTVNNLVFTDGDLDHVVVTPCGLLAVETKYRFRQSDRSRLAKQRRGDLAAAQRAGRKAALLARSRDIASTAQVIPVLVTWGAGQPDLAQGYRVVDGVHLLDGAHPELWAHLFRAPLLADAQRTALDDALHRFKGRQVQHGRDRHTSLQRECWDHFRASVRDSEERRTQRKAHARALTGRHTHPAVATGD